MSVDQYHLSRLQLINWGVFDGYHSIPFSSNGSLITGSSGSGKSSLLDAISLAFLPDHRRNFNASGDATAAGSSSGKRTVGKYVRGAWGERRDGTNAHREIMYLRGTGPAWAAIAVTYTSTSGTAITGLVLKWLAAGKMTDAHSSYFIYDGDADIVDACNEWAAANYNSAKFRDRGWRGGPGEGKYLSTLYSLIGIRGSDAAQQLLGKAKSLKSVGGLAQFVREFMLDAPTSIVGIADALEQIDPLVEARELLDVARRKRTILGNIEEVHERYATESATFSVLDTIDSTTIRSYVNNLRIRNAQPEVADLDDQITRLDGDLAALTTQHDQLRQDHSLLLARIATSTGDLAPLREQLGGAQKLSTEVTARRNAYEDKVSALGFSPPTNAEGFWSLRAELIEEATKIDGQLEAGRAHYAEALAREVAARSRRDTAQEELGRVEQAGSALPRTEHEMRRVIAHALQIDESELKYVAELVELDPDEERWRLAVEKVLRNAGLRLLVPDKHFRSALRFVNSHDMRGRIQLHQAETRPMPVVEPGTLASKLRSVDPGHPCAAEAMTVLAKLGNHMCVDNPGEFSQYAKAVTDQGLRKDSAKLAVKDDRQQLRRSQYIFVGDEESKITALRDELAYEERAFDDAREDCAELDRERSAKERRRDAYRRVCEQFTQWNEIDVDSVDDRVDQLTDQYDLLMEENPDVEALQRKAEDLWEQVRHAISQAALVKDKIARQDERRTQLLDLIDRLKPEEVAAQAEKTLDGFREDLSATLDVLNPEPYRQEIVKAAGRERDRMRSDARRSRDELARILDTYDEEFPDAIPNDSDDFDERIHDYVAVCRRIDERELPSAYERMRRLITEQAPGAILGLHMAADAEERRIVEQIERVNTGLGAVAFNRGTRLRLVPGRKKLAAVEELTEKARQISNRATAVSFGDEQAILEQYSDILLLRERLAGNTPEDRQWTRDALDVRNRFDFYCEEHDAESGETIRTYSNAGDNSGGEQEKLMAFCLAGALSFNLASPHGNDNRPIFAQLMLDEAFSKSDPQFAQQALSAFRKFGFQLIIVATVQNTSTIQPYVDNVVMVSKVEAGPELRPVATATSTTIKAFSELRRSGSQLRV
ncbi:ATP-binding protein [Gordonia alkanivorans]|uniref:ATP-binding protein n=1 Tax=Gordonia alkanivorans TaxID=84096 RepID=UPI001F4D3A18|nr:SbcC/MukB-like Walker B domain-containing protein [Gordonia alkanivorans]MDH3018390.1 SbcC/MukB-like Walker B domain-containing protein [Gordonia alkanivorans]MDH3023604.1 SbcC/MukB-like Walker B domain-containing protein [Gordonia alkanivorans]MDJ0008997.1 SbcC/MukB-like Walker B domain-containing protein [Gordonia alkanivorans]MDJ0098060.1 SbcC/MukB-like Walker B domain-containing protein [Gordonia alkanivorans]MDJ0494572.1 SbcC/MukB-like Walker B domain-containing protein [Gordonia alkan